jgi:hypothetical protein
MYEGIPSTYITNLFATLGSNAVKNISFGDNTAILFLFYFIINMCVFKIFPHFSEGRYLFFIMLGM